MGMQINTNISALNSHRNLSNTQNDLSKSLEKLSSGLRINRAADDAAGLAISEGLRSQVNGLGVAARNAQDGVSVIQTAEGALTEVHSILQRMRDLAVQAGSDSNNADSRKAITTEATALTEELARISDTTNFNGTKLLDGSNTTLSIQIGANGDASNQIDIRLGGADVKKIAEAFNSAAGGASIVVATPTTVTGPMSFSVTEADGSTSTLTTGDVGAAGSLKTVQDLADKLNSDKSFSNKMVATVDKDNNLVVRALSGGTVVGGLVAGTAGSAGTGLATNTVNAAPAGLDFTSATGAAAAITMIDDKITGISAARSDLGAVQNRFESAINSLNVSRENLQSAESRIRDVDMAGEMVKFTAKNILSQAGTAMLAQANQSNQGVLSLLR